MPGASAGATDTVRDRIRARGCDARPVGWRLGHIRILDLLGDLFLIYNHNIREVEGRFRRASNELLVKLQYTFRR